MEFDTNPFFVLSRPRAERDALYSSLVQPEAIDKIVAWFAARNRVITREEAHKLLPQVIAMLQCHPFVQ